MVIKNKQQGISEFQNLFFGSPRDLLFILKIFKFARGMRQGVKGNLVHQISIKRSLYRTLSHAFLT
jgi:hypothetical protein